LKADVEHSVVESVRTPTIHVDHLIVGLETTPTIHVDHSIVGLERTSTIHVDHSHRPGVVCSSLPTISGARQSPPKGRLRNGLLGSRLAGVEDGGTLRIHVEHSH